MTMDVAAQFLMDVEAHVLTDVVAQEVLLLMDVVALAQDLMVANF